MCILTLALVVETGLAPALSVLSGRSNLAAVVENLDKVCKLCYVICVREKLIIHI